jgi:hypothetical protein
MVVTFPQNWVLTNHEGRFYWALLTQKSGGFLWRHLPFTITRKMRDSREMDGSTEMHNLANVVNQMFLENTSLTQISLPERARPIVSSYLHSGNTPYLWGCPVQFIPDHTNLVVIKTRKGKVIIPWD